MMDRSLLISFAAAVLVTVAPGFESEAAAANLYTRVPASACSPESPDDDAILQLSNGSWIFTGSDSGTATLWCPIVTDKGHSALDTYSISNLRLWYRDTDGTATGSQVTAQLYYRAENATNPSSMTAGIDSNSSSATSNNTLWADVTTNTTSNALFFVRVTISRNSSSLNVAFHGIDLPQTPP
ncbi:hypothetical protein OV203_01305 [Nannocystis sp. ILAH1]|uniref:hypothetical protein n=1 Tax=unclassified Nannocystis TaxID=2627009 RepID=UPI00226E9E76|nr:MULTISPECIES: hypothetical protein [unclassified Nannocystis]MCY0985747.1 hypothetical protein [Nannocystis sp. ILAH1]MCY1068430.1 hypothetical protein [Nannocystis sp. RBIL2]